MRRKMMTPGSRTPAGARGRARRQKEAATAPTAATSEGVSACALQVARGARTLSARPLDPAEAEELDRRTDPQAAAVGAVLCRTLPGAPSVSKATGVQPGAIEGLLAQRGELVNLHLSARQYLQDTGAARRVLGGEVRRILGRLLQRTRRQAEADAELRSDAGEFLHAADAVSAGRKEEAQRTLGRRRAEDAELEAERDRGEMLRAILALRDGEEVDAAVIDGATAAYASAAGGAERTTAPAPAPGRRNRRR